MSLRFLVFQHIECEHPGIFRDLMTQRGITWDPIELDVGESIPAFDGYDALLVMGGPMDVWQHEENPWLIPEIDAISKWVRSGRPYLGFCLGHQLLARALGGEVSEAAQPEIGILPVELTTTGTQHWFFKNCTRQMMTLQWHSAEVLGVPEGGEILAESEACKVNAMSWGPVAVSVQFHVELTERTIQEWGEIPAYKSALESVKGAGALELMSQESDQNMKQFNALSETLFHNFVTQIEAIS